MPVVAGTRWFRVWGGGREHGEEKGTSGREWERQGVDTGVILSTIVVERGEKWKDRGRTGSTGVMGHSGGRMGGGAERSFALPGPSDRGSARYSICLFACRGNNVFLEKNASFCFILVFPDGKLSV